jgi:hypothetical protein
VHARQQGAWHGGVLRFETSNIRNMIFPEKLKCGKGQQQQISTLDYPQSTI